MYNDDCKDCNDCKVNQEQIQKRRQIQVSYNSGGYSVTITSDYKKDDIDFLTIKTKDLINDLKQSKSVVM